MPHKQGLNDKTLEILLLMSSGLSYKAIAQACGASRAWVYAVARREMKRLGTNDAKALFFLTCESQIQQAQEMRIGAERLILLASELENSARTLQKRLRQSEPVEVKTTTEAETRMV